MASTRIPNLARLQIPLEDIIKATNNFHPDNIISEGTFGPAYKGLLLRSGKLMKIAARRLDPNGVMRDSDFRNEVTMLSDLKHTNLVSLIGFCDEKDVKIVVTAYDAKGSLEQFLDSQDLTWTQRLRICVGVARALSYLHSGDDRSYAVIHRYINSYTILLDENWKPKLSCFELSIGQSIDRLDEVRLCDPIGAPGYMDPEIEYTEGVTHKSDIYSFGVVLFELLCGRKAFVENENESKMFLDSLAKKHYEKETLQEIINSHLWGQMSSQSFLKYSQLAYSCLKERAYRPDAKRVLNELQNALEFQLRRENLEKKLEHLKMHLSDAKLAIDNCLEMVDNSDITPGEVYVVNLENIDKPNPSIIEAKNKGGPPLAIMKCFLPKHGELGEGAFFAELETLTSAKHNNIVNILGFCVDGPKMMLLKEYSSKSYLAYYLVNDMERRLLTWERRLKICIDVAKALSYLHFEMEDQKTIIKCNINTMNILLDENWRAKIDNFGMSVCLPPNQEEVVHHNYTSLEWLCHNDPEYEKKGKLKKEADVYSFGVVLFEILCGKMANDSIYVDGSLKGLEGLAFLARRSVRMEKIKEMIDPIIMDDNSFILRRGPNKDSLDTFIKVAYHCVSETQDKRPTMKLVIRYLERALSFQTKANPRISYEDIKMATRNFHKDNCVGAGGYGNVYKGNLQDGDRAKAIVAKQLDTKGGQGKQQFLSELQILLDYKHSNVIDLVGYCDEKDEKIIVYEYAPRGSLNKYLKDASLTWVKRLNICIDVARALDFLHGGAGKQAKVVHRDIKTQNILLYDDWKAKLGDFGLSLISPLNDEKSYIIDPVCGTEGYQDPVYNEGYLTTKSDVYSFGVVLFEILCGRFARLGNQSHHLLDFVKNKFEEGKHDEVVFEQIKKDVKPTSLTTFQKIAYQCLHYEIEKRPTIKEVLIQLEKALELQVHGDSRDQVLEGQPEHSTRSKVNQVQK